MKVAMVLWCRDKAHMVRRSVRSLLDQTYSPMEIVLSDQGSRDGTLEILHDMAGSYAGENEITVVSCPLTSYRGIMGLNAHMAWLMERLDHDIIISASADDLNYPTRAERIVEAFRAHKPDYVATAVKFTRDGVDEGQGVVGDASNFIGFAQNINLQIGFQCGGSWTRELWQKHGPMHGIEAPDLILPSMAALERGLYFINEVLHEGIHDADPYGVSCERAMQAVEEGPEKRRLVETNCHQFVSSHFSLARRIAAAGIRMVPDAQAALSQKIMNAAHGWCQQRDALTVDRMPPLGLRV